MDNAPEKKSKLQSPLLTGLLISAIVLLIWYFLWPLLGLAIGLTTGAFIVIIGTFILLAAAIFLSPILAGMALFFLSAFVGAWFIFAIILFPLTFPVIAPVLIIILLLYLFKKRTKS